MEKRVYILISIAVVLALIGGIFMFSKNSELLIGGQRDEYGCLGPAGYSWNENLGVCARQWEITGETQEQAIQTATAHLKQRIDSYGLTYTDIDVNECEGCFVVHFSDKDNNPVSVSIENWIVTE